MSGTFVDSRNEKTYGWVRIRNQIWMAENLNFAHEDSRCYEDRETNCTTYGRLYNWNTAMANSASSTTNPSGIQGICPSGWHLPSEAEWGTLMQSINPNCPLTGNCAGAGKYLKATEGWNGVGGNGTDAYGFAAMPGGYGLANGTFTRVGNTGNWLSATESNSTQFYIRYIDYDGEYVNRDGYYYKTNLFSVRCVKD
jgi:uncharacterized protein (TIGR02145 family)